MKLAVVGITGLVGRVITEVLEAYKLPLSMFIPVASARSAGKQVQFCKQAYTVLTPEEALEMHPDIVIFSAGSDTSKKWAPEFVRAGSYVVDNSSAWRMDESVPLIVPEVNGNILKKHHKIIANPNCSTIQLVVALAPLHTVYGIKKIHIATYQSVSGSGKEAVEQLNAERRGMKSKQAYPHPIDLNCFPFGGSFLDNGYSTEEMKLVHETRKILGAPAIEVNATVVRIPVLGGHSEAVYVEFEKNVDIDTVNQLLQKAKGVEVQDDIAQHLYPMPLYAENRDEVFVGRIRKGLFNDHSVHMWIVADNLRKGAATNAVQIAQIIINNKFL